MLTVSCLVTGSDVEIFIQSLRAFRRAGVVFDAVSRKLSNASLHRERQQSSQVVGRQVLPSSCVDFWFLSVVPLSCGERTRRVLKLILQIHVLFSGLKKLALPFLVTSF